VNNTISADKFALAVQTKNVPQAVQLSAAPLCNTGAVNTQGVAPSVIVDWLTFVILDEQPRISIIKRAKKGAKKGRSASPVGFRWSEQAARFRDSFGAEGDWSEKSSGALGYRRSMRNGGITIFYDHAEAGRGVCVAVSGKGCRQLEEQGYVRTWAGWVNLLSRLTSTAGVHLTRLDVAYDDRAGLLDMARISEYVQTGRVVSRFKSAYTIQKTALDPAAAQARGLTVNFGSRSSRVMARFYDKAAEQDVAGHWVRCEVEAKDERAQELARLLADCPGGEEGAVVAGVLRNYISFRETDATDSNRSRWEEAGWWLAFVGAVARVRLSVGLPVRTWEKTRAWVEAQVAPALAVLYDGAASGKDLLAELVQDGRRRWKSHHRRLVTNERARLSQFAGVPTGF
jgi:phage replication initiation protein